MENLLSQIQEQLEEVLQDDTMEAEFKRGVVFGLRFALYTASDDWEVKLSPKQKKGLLNLCKKQKKKSSFETIDLDKLPISTDHIEFLKEARSRLQRIK